MKLSPARRVVFGAALLLAVIGLFNLFRGFGLIEILRLPFVGGVGVPGPLFREGTWSLLFAFALMNLLVLLEVADRLSLKNDLEIARDIQQAMLPSGLYTAPGVETVGMSRPANTVGGDFYDILPLDDGRLVITLGDVAGKGSPAALLMALLLAMLRTLVDEKLEPADAHHAAERAGLPPRAGHALHHAVLRASSTRAPATLTYVSAGHMPPLLLRGDGSCERLTDGGIALGMFEHSTYTTGHVVDPAGRSARGLQRRHHRGGEPARACRSTKIGLETALKASRARQPLRRSARPSSARSNGTPTDTSSPTISRFCCCAAAPRRRRLGV